jgi:transcriptional regulator with XRE-family HTH domain
MSALILQRRVELGLSYKQLARATGIVAEALKDAERRETFDHFTVDQMKRLDDALGLDLTAALRSEEDDYDPISAGTARLGAHIASNRFELDVNRLLEDHGLTPAELDERLDLLRLRLAGCGLMLDEVVGFVGIISKPTDLGCALDSWQPHDREISDAQTVALFRIADEEAASGVWSEFANQDKPASVVRELLRCGALETRGGRVWVAAEVLASLDPVLEKPEDPDRVARFSSEFARAMSETLVAARK